VAVIAAGFLLRANPVLVVIAACGVTGAAGAAARSCTVLESLGTAFIKTRNLPLILLLPLAAIGLLERYGLKEHAQASIAKIRSATTGRLLIVYLLVREITAAFGLTSLGGHPNMVRPLVAPMAEGAAEARYHGKPAGRAAPPHPRDERRHRQRRPVLRRGRVRRLRRHRADADHPARRRAGSRSAAHGAVGHPDGGDGLHHPRWNLRRLDARIRRARPPEGADMILALDDFYTCWSACCCGHAIMTCATAAIRAVTTPCSGDCTRWSTWPASACRRRWPAC
jgi:hypothetical protein